MYAFLTGEGDKWGLAKATDFCLSYGWLVGLWLLQLFPFYEESCSLV